MILLTLLAGAALTWYIDKNFTNGGITNFEGEKIKIDSKKNFTNLGYEKQLSKNIPWDVSRAKSISPWRVKNPLPLIDIQKGGENLRVSEFSKQPILPNQKARFAKLVHQRENLEEYFRFDPYLGGIYPDQRPPERHSTISYRYK